MEEGKWGWTNYVISCTLACGSYEISLLTSMNCVNLYKFVASFPSDFRVSRTPDFLWQFRCSLYVGVYGAFFFFLFSCFELCITVYLRKFTLPRIPSHHDITCFLACWLGNFFTTYLNQISSLLTLSILSKIPLITTVSSSEQFSAL